MASTPLETLRIAHSARCKLNLAANRPDRNFRFILGHALTLDKVMLRVAEIEFTGEDEKESSSESDNEMLKERHVGFSGPAKARGIGTQRTQRRSLSPPAPQPGVDVDDDDEPIEDDEDEEGDGAPLERFPSASAVPPRKVAPDHDEGIGDMDENGGQERVSEWSEEQLKRITAEHGSAELVEVYNHIAGCPCHGLKAPMVENVWEVPSEMDGQMGGRMAVVQVQA